MIACCLLLLLMPVDDLAQQRLAHARARQEMLQLVFAMPHESGQTLGSWARADAEREVTIRTWLHSLPRFDDARRYPDGSVEVDLVLSPNALATQFDLPDKWARERALLWATGRALAEERPQADVSPSWDAVSAEGRARAERAALSHAVYTLRRQLLPIALQPGESIGEKLDEAFAQTRFQAALHERVAVTYTHTPAQLVQAQVTLEPANLEAALLEVLGAELDLRRLRLQDLGPRLQATGVAGVLVEDRAVQRQAPAWAERVLRVAVESPAGADDEARLRQLRTAAAPLLWEKLLRLRVADETTIADLCDAQPNLRAALQTVVSGGRVVTLKAAGGAAQVDLPLRAVWRMLARGNGEQGTGNRLGT